MPSALARARPGSTAGPAVASPNGATATARDGHGDGQAVQLRERGAGPLAEQDVRRPARARRQGQQDAR